MIELLVLLLLGYCVLSLGYTLFEALTKSIFGCFLIATALMSFALHSIRLALICEAISILPVVLYMYINLLYNHRKNQRV